jgi:hypothetical protein
MKHIFFMGNKRSGTSVLARLLNVHPAVFVFPEADVAWILYCLVNGKELAPYPLDGFHGFNRTMQNHGELVRTPFTDIAKHGDALMLALASHKGRDVSKLEWIGDKKPTQQADPALFNFLCDLYPEAHFVHIIRDPTNVARSHIKRFKIKNPDKPVPTARDYYAKWLKTEQWVMQDKASNRAPIFSVTYADVLRDPSATASSVLKSLGLEVSEAVAARINTMVDPSRDAAYEKSSDEIPKEVRSIASSYGL